MTTLVSSKAPAQLLARLAEQATAAGTPVGAQAGGGVEVERRVAEGEAIDIVVLAAGAIRRLAENGHVVGEPRTLLITDAVAAVRTGDVAPDLTSADTLRAAVESARAVGISTGPSGDAVKRVLESWGLADRAVVARPGIPVGRLLVDGEVDLAFQQRTELEGMDGVDVAGPLPEPLALTTAFVGAVTAAAADPAAARAALDLLADLAGAPDQPTKE